MKRNNKKGFTIVELVIVIAVIAILAGVLIPTFSGIVEKANASAALQEAQNAYKEAFANAIATDGVIGATENASATGGWTFNFTNTDGVIATSSVTTPDGFGYTVTVNAGVVSVEKAS